MFPGLTLKVSTRLELFSVVPSGNAGVTSSARPRADAPEPVAADAARPAADSASATSPADAGCWVERRGCARARLRDRSLDCAGVLTTGVTGGVLASASIGLVEAEAETVRRSHEPAQPRPGACSAAAVGKSRGTTTNHAATSSATKAPPTTNRIGHRATTRSGNQRRKIDRRGRGRLSRKRRRGRGQRPAEPRRRSPKWARSRSASASWASADSPSRRRCSACDGSDRASRPRPPGR